LQNRLANEDLKAVIADVTGVSDEKLVLEIEAKVLKFRK
jgi:hypothetical protein